MGEEESERLLERAKARLGTVLRDKYRLDRVLGLGGMAAVYKATHRNSAEYAVKVLHPELSLDNEVRTRFLREGYAANSVKHPGAVRIHDDDVAEDGSAFLVMELLDGVSVEELWDRCSERLPVPIACAIGLRLLDVLAAAHAKGIIHRDVKPANVFVTRAGEVKVLDFGIARVRTAAGHSTTQSLAPFGTPAFMSPEQALAKSAEIDDRSDVFATGAMLFTLVSGAIAHRGDNAAQILVSAATQQARSLAEEAPDAPLEVVAVVDRALAFNRDARWSSAREMRERLADAVNAAFGHLPTTSDLAGFVERVAPDRRLDDSVTLPRKVPVRPKPVLPATLTENPVSSHADAPPRPLPYAPLAAVLALVVLAGVGIALAAFRRHPSAATPAPPVSASASAEPSATVVAAPLVTVAPEPPPTGTPTPPPPAPAPPPPRLTATVRAPAASAAPKPVAPPPPSASAPARCNPPYYFDATGEKHFYVDCF